MSAFGNELARPAARRAFQLTIRIKAGLSDAYTAIHLTHSGSVSTITLDRSPVNAAHPILLAGMLAALNELEARDGTRCIVFTGEFTGAAMPAWKRVADARAAHLLDGSRYGPSKPYGGGRPATRWFVEQGAGRRIENHVRLFPGDWANAPRVC